MAATRYQSAGVASHLKTTRFDPRNLPLPPAECSPGDDRHSDDGVHSGDGERGEGGGLRPSVLILRLRGGNTL